VGVWVGAEVGLKFEIFLGGEAGMCLAWHAVNLPHLVHSRPMPTDSPGVAGWTHAEVLGLTRMLLPDLTRCWSGQPHFKHLVHGLKLCRAHGQAIVVSGTIR